MVMNNLIVFTLCIGTWKRRYTETEVSRMMMMNEVGKVEGQIRTAASSSNSKMSFIPLGT